MAVGLYGAYYPYCHFYAMHKTYGTLCKNQEEQDGAICKKTRTWLSPLRAATYSPMWMGLLRVALL